MFRRREKPPLLMRIRNWFWPRRGWKRAIAFYWHRLKRIPGTPESIAAGFACGLACAFSPLLGTHTILAALLAWGMGGSVIAALVGTLCLNPWTAPPVWYASYELGALILPGSDGHKAGIAEFVAMFGALTRSALSLNGELFMQAVWPVFRPMLVGSIPLGIVAGFVAYFALAPVLRRVQENRALKRGRRAEGHD